jgi:2',3'-cyclic-nucleotide 2'-phosphodiesterase (5'-nucleotidase family)
LIKATRQQSANVLLLDAGDTLFGQQPLAQQSNAKVLIDGMNLMGYNAMVIGDLDLQLGLEILRQRIADSKFPILSANLMVAGENKLLSEPYTVLDVGGRKVGIIGLTWDGLSPDDPSIKGKFLLLKADLVLPQYVTEVSQQADIVILLSNMGYEEDQRLSSAVPGIDLIVGGRSRMPMNEAWRNETTGTLIVQAGAQGEWIGRRQLHIDSAGVVTEHQDELIYLTDDFADDPEMQAFLDNYPVQ